MDHNNDDRNGLLFLIFMGLIANNQNGKPVNAAVKRRRSIYVKFYLAFLCGLAAMYTHWVFDAPLVESAFWLLLVLLVAKAWHQLSAPIAFENDQSKPDLK